MDLEGIGPSVALPPVGKGSAKPGPQKQKASTRDSTDRACWPFVFLIMRSSYVKIVVMSRGPENKFGLMSFLW